MKIMDQEKHYCLFCDKPLKGRSDKKFCNADCRNAYNNQAYKEDELEIRRTINILKKNRRILKTLLGTAKGKKEKKDLMMRKGFSFDYFTQVSGSYRFCFEYGYTGTASTDYYFIVKGFGNIVNKE